jgi:integrase
MGTDLRKAPGMREKAPGVWELFVQAGIDPTTGRRRQVSRTFHGNLRDAKKARAELLVEVSKGHHTGTRATVDELFEDWILELERKGRSPNTVYNYRKTYRANIAAALGTVEVAKVTTKMLTDLYGAHQRRGLKPRTIYQIHATVSSMFTQACRWGWRDTNPAQWAEVPAFDNEVPVVPTPAEVMALLEEAEASRAPDKARALFVAATTGVRRAELCALKRNDIDWDRSVLTVARSIVVLSGRVVDEIPTKNRRARPVALDNLTLGKFREQLAMLAERAAFAGVPLVDNPYVFSDEIDGAIAWKPDAVSRFFTRVRSRVGLEHLDLHSLRKFMETYGQDLGFSPAAVAMRAGHDPSVMARHYTGRVDQADRDLAAAVAGLITPEL